MKVVTRIVGTIEHVLNSLPETVRGMNNLGRRKEEAEAEDREVGECNVTPCGVYRFEGFTEYLVLILIYSESLKFDSTK